MSVPVFLLGGSAPSTAGSALCATSLRNAEDCCTRVLSRSAGCNRIEVVKPDARPPARCNARREASDQSLD